MAKMKKLVTLTMVGSLLMASQSGVAAIEIQEDEFGPSYETAVVDTVVGKPLQLVAAVSGTVAFIASYPFSYVSGSTEMSKENLVIKPWQAMERCLGCTVSEDKYYKSLQTADQNSYRVVVDGPSEIIISTDDNVIINDTAGTVVTQ